MTQGIPEASLSIDGLWIATPNLATSSEILEPLTMQHPSLGVCASERILKLIELTDIELEAVSGGAASPQGVYQEERHEAFQAELNENFRSSPPPT